MASVSSLDRDMKNIRLSKYTPTACKEVRSYIEDTLGEKLRPGDLMEALKDGIALCKLANLIEPRSIKFKESNMPFVQMENISHFLRACQAPPLNLHSHDIFQTVALYESKDPAQVLQCIAAFSRSANAVDPIKFPAVLGEKGKGVGSPQSTSGRLGGGTASPLYGRSRGASNVSDALSIASGSMRGRSSSPFKPSNVSTTKSPSGAGTGVSGGGISSWTNKSDESKTIPAWNIHQYGYMGGASQGNQGISFGARRQITSPAPKIPTLAEKERERRLKEEEEARQRQVVEEAEAEQRRAAEAARLAEEQEWEAETQRQRLQEKQRMEQEKQRWDEEQRRWKQEEEERIREENEEEAKAEAARNAPVERSTHTAQNAKSPLTGQYLSHYQADKKTQDKLMQHEQHSEPAPEPTPSRPEPNPTKSKELQRIEELERRLRDAETRARDAELQQLQQQQVQAHPLHTPDPAPEPESPMSSPRRSLHDSPPRQLPTTADSALHYQTPQAPRSRPLSFQRPSSSSRPTSSWEQEARTTITLPNFHSSNPPSPHSPANAAYASSPKLQQAPPSPRPLPNTAVAAPHQFAQVELESPPSPQARRPLPDPATYSVPDRRTSPTRQSPFTRPSAPTPSHAQPQPQPASPSLGLPHAGPSSILSREMELDRQRQRDWEDDQVARGALPVPVRRTLLGPRQQPGRS